MLEDQLYKLVCDIADLRKDGEDDMNGETYIMENDDAYDTLHSLISRARRMLGLPDFYPPAKEEE